MIKYDVTECRRADLHFGPDSHLLWHIDSIFRYPISLFEGNKVKGYMFMIVWLQGICKSKMACFTYFINTIDMNRAAEGNLIRNQEEGETGAKMDS